MHKPENLLNRLDEIGKALSKKPDALALIGLGSVGIELNRLDQFSDLDFFVIVKAGSKPHYLEGLDWLTSIAPIAYYFANTPDGFKLLYQDDVFCEFAVFDEDELGAAVFSPGRVVWKAKGISDEIGIPKLPIQRKQQPSTEWLIGEALTNLYIGLKRDQRGEKLSAMRFIQSYAVDRILELSEKIETVEPIVADEFNIERRYEQRIPAMARLLPEFLQGYQHNRESALAALSYVDRNFEINPAFKQSILKLCGNVE
jgi:hypothetical protein